MIAGVPGTGIGGLFYMLLVLWMPFRLVSARMRGRIVTAAEWWVAAKLFSFGAAIVLALVVEAMLLKFLIVTLLHVDLEKTTVTSQHIRAAEGLIPTVGLTAVAILVCVLLGVRLLSLLVRREARPDLSPRR
jgi:hypothetical protein